MVDPAVVSRKLRQIEQYHGELREKQDLSRDQFLDDVTEQRAVERMFENAIQACVDLAKHVATREFGYRGDSSKEAIERLRENGVVTDDTAETLVDAAGFRNVLAHQYGEIEPDAVYEYLQSELDVYDTFSRELAGWFEQRE